MHDVTRLRDFVRSMSRLMDRHAGGDEPALLADARPLLLDLVRQDDWLPDEFARPDPHRYRQYLLHCDPLERFSVVSFVWGPGQTTPIHDHRVWGMVAVLRGAELCEEFDVSVAGAPRAANSHRLEPGDVDLVSPRIGDVHRVSNALADRPSVSIHVYGGNIGAIRRHVYDPDSGRREDFVSGYSAAVIPNLWGATAASAPPAGQD